MVCLNVTGVLGRASVYPKAMDLYVVTLLLFLNQIIEHLSLMAVAEGR